MDSVVQAAGVVIVTRGNPRQVLLMEHADRLDLPKGHVEPQESLREAAIRETHEETGITAGQLELEADFAFAIEYEVRDKRRGDYHKRTTYFLAWIDAPVEVRLTEHVGYRWETLTAEPRQAATIDPLLTAVVRHIEGLPA